MLARARLPRTLAATLTALCVLIAAVACGGAGGGAGGDTAGTNAGTPDTSGTLPPTAAFLGNVVLGAPTRSSVRANVFTADLSGTVWIAYGTTPETADAQSTEQALVAGRPLEIALDGLAADTRYYYRVRYRAASAGAATAQSELFAFRTARATGGTFSFTIQADSHLDENSDLDLYRRTLGNVRADAPDFHIDLGDTFMSEKHAAPLTALVQSAPDQATVDARYAYERANFGLVAHSSPLFLVNGNHDGELGWLLDGKPDNLALWTARARRSYYANPTPDGFYSGDTEIEPLLGARRASWYAWTWGDALFVVLDPYWATAVRNGPDGWTNTLGARQYQWLATTLAASRATFKFVFIHNLVGGLGLHMRGGVEAAPFFEWGGRSADGTNAFAQQRPGWAAPIHTLLVQNRVTAVFHGHDHLYARQELDGIVYQAVPQPSTRNTGNATALAAEGQYASGTILGSSGHLRVTVTPTGVTTQYVRAWVPQDETALRRNGQVDDTWSVAAPKSP